MFLSKIRPWYFAIILFYDKIELKEGDCVAHNKEDIIMKHAMKIFAEQAVAYFGERKKVKEIAQTEQVILDIKDTRMDYVFLMEDDTYTHFEFQTTDKRITDLVRFNLYDVLLYQQTKKQVYTYVVYSGDIKTPLTSYNNGFSEYKVKAICMADKDAETILNDIECKLVEGKILSDKELLDLVFIPIMGGTLGKEDKIIRAFEISEDYPIDKKRDVQAMLCTFALKFLNTSELKQVKEVIRMTDLGRALMEEGMEKGREEGKIDIVRELLKDGSFTKEQIEKVTKIPMEKIEELEKDLLALQ